MCEMKRTDTKTLQHHLIADVDAIFAVEQVENSCCVENVYFVWSPFQIRS